MASFIGRFVNKVDRKGRVSVPARFRQVLAEHKCQDIIIFRSLEVDAIEACTQPFMDRLIAGVGRAEQSVEGQNALSLALFGDVAEIPFDNEGRMLLPGSLASFASVTNTAAFIGRGEYFQIWQPEALDSAMDAARTHAKSAGVSLPGLARLGDQP